MDTIDPRGMAEFDPGACLAQFIMGTTKHCYIQNIEALGLLVSEKKIFLVFPIVSLWRLIYPQGVAKFDPRGMAGIIYVEDH